MAFFLFLLYLTSSYIFPGELFPELAPYRITLWLGVVSLAASVLTLAPTGKLIICAAPIGLVAGLILSMMVSMMRADKWLGAPIQVVQQFGPVLTLFLLAVWNITTLRRLKLTGALLVLLGFVVTGQAVAAYHFGYMQDKLIWHGNDSPEAAGDSETQAPALVRVRGLGQMNDPNDLALVLVATLPFLGLAWKEGRDLRNVVLLGVPAAFLIYGVYLTRSRGGMLGGLAVLLVGLVQRVGRGKALLATAVIGTTIMAVNFSGGRAISTSDESAQGRVEAWSEGLAMLRSSPVLGVGFQNFTEHNELTAHNSFVLCFAELGVVGYFFWLGLLVLAILQVKQVRQCADGFKTDELHQHSQVLIAAFAGTLVAAFFLSRTYSLVLYLLVGLALALYRIAREGGHSVSLPSLYGVAGKIITLELASILAMYVVVRIDGLFVL